jgi:hypothetical protein
MHKYTTVEAYCTPLTTKDIELYPHSNIVQYDSLPDPWKDHVSDLNITEDHFRRQLRWSRRCSAEWICEPRIAPYHSLVTAAFCLA